MAPVSLECPVNLEVYKEREWQAAVINAAGHYKWWHIHFPDVRYNKKARGWPDLLLLRGDEFRLLELKTMKGELRPVQIELHHELWVYDVPVYVLRPCEEDWARMVEILK